MNTSKNSYGVQQRTPLTSTNKQRPQSDSFVLRHIYDDHSLTFGDIKRIFLLASNGCLHATQKIDGSFLSFSWDDESNQVVVARTNGEIFVGGLTKQQMYEKYSSQFCIKRGIRDAFCEAIDVLTELFREHTSVFKDKSIWLPIEVVYTNPDHTICYDTKNIVFHETPVQFFDKTTRKINQYALNISLQDIFENRTTINDWTIHHPLFVTLTSYDIAQLKIPYEQFVYDLEYWMYLYDLTYENTVQDFLFMRALRLLDDELITTTQVVDEIVKRILKLENYKNTTQLKKLDKSIDYHLYIDNKSFFNEILFPIRHIIDTFEHSFISLIDCPIKGDVSITENILLQTLASEQYTESLKIHSKYLLDTKQIFPLEGFVFSFNDKYYKSTGQFAAINQILNIARKQPR